MGDPGRDKSSQGVMGTQDHGGGLGAASPWEGLPGEIWMQKGEFPNVSVFWGRSAWIVSLQERH